MKWLILALAGIIGLALIWMTLPVRQWLLTTVERIDAMGVWGIVVYFVLYFCLASATFPSTPLNVGAGLIFHFTSGFLVAWTAGVLASMATFLFSRYVGREWAERRLKLLPNCNAFVKSVESQGFQVVLLARLNPFIPASIKNFGFGLTSISFASYTAATAVGQLPIVLAYVYLGWAGSATLLRDGQPSGVRTMLIVAGIAISASTLLLVNRWGRNVTPATEG